MEESNVQRVITAQLQSLVQNYLPPTLTQSEQQNYLAYFLRVISSRAYTPVMEDDGHLSMLVRKRISRCSAKSSQMVKVSRFQVLFDKLSNSKVVLKKWPILYCLYSISEDVSGGPPIAAIVQKSMGGSILSKVQPQAYEKMIVEPGAPIEEVKERKANLFGSVREEEILRDLLYVFQEIDGKYISYSLLDDTYAVSSSIAVAESAKEMVLELCELGWLYKKVIDYVRKHSDNIYAGQVVQSFCFAIQGELNEYFRLLAVLEQQLQGTAVTPANGRLNLMKLYLWMQEPMERMKWLAAICDTTQSICLWENVDLKGGVLASTIQQHAYRGTSSLSRFVGGIFQEVCAPLLNMIRQWMIHGDAHDLYGDFFVATDPSVHEDRMWYDKYSLNTEQIPTFLTYDIAHKVFLTGKAINFIRKCCSEPEWTVPAELQEPSIKDYTEMIENVGAIEEWIQKIYAATNSRLVSLLFSKYCFLDHCESLRRYLLLAQGDFHHYLMDLIYETLSKPAEQIYK